MTLVETATAVTLVGTAMAMAMAAMVTATLPGTSLLSRDSHHPRPRGRQHPARPLSHPPLPLPVS